MSSIGHIITLMGIIFFFFMFSESIYERRAFILSILGIPRWHKRVNYLLYKIKYLNFSLMQIFSFPRKAIRYLLARYYENEYETLKA